MHTFLTPEPITVEIRNASGEIRVDLADVATTTVDVVASAAHPLGFLDDVFRAVAAKAQSVGAGRVGGSESPAADGFGGADTARRSRPSGSGSISGKRRKAGPARQP